MDNFRLFSNWLNQVLEEDIPKGIKAFNFNLYEGEEDTYDDPYNWRIATVELH
ncbi:hypothetical protein [Bacillus sp. MRMR6]|uniref:hypothetical protein n=1 Tax=Bacillus sp. MRMR6 TaxID=1928617 RepID=UPI00158B407B|nr:hypothetical protein [Bacillus sp. MRMR6]